MDIYKEIEALQQKMDLLLTIVGGETTLMTVPDIARMYGKSRTTLYASNRWLLPNFGLAEDGSRISEWTRGEVLKWNSRPIQERKKEMKERVFPLHK